MNTALFAAVLLLQALTLTGVALLWWRSRRAAESRPASGADWERSFRSLERYLDGKVDLLLAQILAQRPKSPDLAEILGALRPARDNDEQSPRAAEQAAAPAALPPSEPVPLQLDRLPTIPQREEEASLTDERRLAQLLDSSAFLDGIWPDLNGSYEDAVRRFLRYLTEEGLPEPVVEPVPSLGAATSNHWLFLVVSYRNPQAASRRFLIPCNYSRYDPLIHDHLFQVLGAGGSVDSFVRELRRCSLLEAHGELQGFIPKNLVVKKGVFVV